MEKLHIKVLYMHSNTVNTVNTLYLLVCLEFDTKTTAVKWELAKFNSGENAN